MRDLRNESEKKRIFTKSQSLLLIVSDKKIDKKQITKIKLQNQKPNSFNLKRKNEKTYLEIIFKTYQIAFICKKKSKSSFNCY